MILKYWSSAGLMLTYWCNARCASCYVCCSPDHSQWMSVDDAVKWWKQLQDASPLGCRIHITGGEPFGDYERLIAICRKAKDAGLGPLDKVETNGFWATDEKIIRQRIYELDQAGMHKFGISADPYHQRYIPLDRCRKLAEMARKMLGENRVKVRWESWLNEGCDTFGMGKRSWRALLKEYCKDPEVARERMNGRAVNELSGIISRKSAEFFSDSSCGKALLRSKHIHIGLGGEVLPGTCAGLVLGKLDDSQTITDIWSSLESGWKNIDVISQLVSGGPVRLMELAEKYGFEPDSQGYCSKCHLCWMVRRFFAKKDMFKQVIAPKWMYL